MASFPMENCPGYALAGCPSRYYCYPSPESEVSAELTNRLSTSGICLCNRVQLFYGDECEKTGTISYFSRPLIYMYQLYCIFFLLKTHLTLRYRSTIAPNAVPGEILSASLVYFLAGAGLSVAFMIDVIRLDSNFSDRWWEARGMVYVFSVSQYFGCLNAIYITKALMNKLGSLHNSTSVCSCFLVPSWKTILCISNAVLAAVALGTALVNTKIVWLGFMIIFIWVITIMTFSFYKTKRFLAAASLMRTEVIRLQFFHAMQKLHTFSAVYLRWATIFIFSDTSFIFLNMDSDMPAILPHSAQCIAWVAFIQLQLCQCDYLLHPEVRLGPVQLLSAWWLQLVLLVKNRMVSWWSRQQQNRVLPVFAPTSFPAADDASSAVVDHHHHGIVAPAANPLLVEESIIVRGGSRQQ